MGYWVIFWDKRILVNVIDILIGLWLNELKGKFVVMIVS